MEDFVAAVLVMWIAVSTVLSGIFLARDYRHFDIIKHQCTSQGFIQNHTARINCSLEERK